MGGFLRMLLDTLFPSRCVVCGKSISYFDNCLCSSCLSSIERVSEGCTFCSGVLVEGRCTVCADRAWYPARNIILAEYSAVMREILHSYKFHRRRRLHHHLSILAADELGKQNLPFDVVSAVPTSGRKKWKRGYNQSELIARSIAKRAGKYYRILLKERAGARPQRELRYHERFLNILGRYEMRRPVAPLRVLLVDDVFTTGATINECARILMAQGSREVYTLTIARAQGFHLSGTSGRVDPQR
jgi:competence protein ComFC